MTEQTKAEIEHELALTQEALALCLQRGVMNALGSGKPYFLCDASVYGSEFVPPRHLHAVMVAAQKAAAQLSKAKRLARPPDVGGSTANTGAQYPCGTDEIVIRLRPDRAFYSDALFLAEMRHLVALAVEQRQIAERSYEQGALR
jgi:hypothetical protein